MIPGEWVLADGPVVCNAGKPAVTLEVTNRGDRPVQVGSHYHFYEVNDALVFDRSRAFGMRLDIPAGTAVRFEPGDTKTVNLVPYGGSRQVYGFQGRVNGSLDAGLNTSLHGSHAEGQDGHRDGSPDTEGTA